MPRSMDVIGVVGFAVLAAGAALSFEGSLERVRISNWIVGAVLSYVGFALVMAAMLARWFEPASKNKPPGPANSPPT